MISVEEALTEILNSIQILDSQEKTLLDCLGQVLAEDVYSPLDIPPHDNSAMDGYAVQAGSIKGASHKNPKILRVIGEIAAGSISDLKVGPGQLFGL